MSPTVVPATSSTIPTYQVSPTPNDLLSLVAVVSIRVPTLQHVPKVLRKAWAGVVMNMFNLICARPTDLEAWTKLFMLAMCVLVRPFQKGHYHWRDTLRIIKDRIRRWKAGDFCSLWSEVITVGIRLHNHRRRKATLESQCAGTVRRAR